MQKEMKRSITILTSFLLCLNHFSMPTTAEEENVPEATEAPVTEVIDDESVEEEIIEITEETEAEDEESIDTIITDDLDFEISEDLDIQEHEVFSSFTVDNFTFSTLYDQDNGVELSKYTGNDSVVTIPSTAEGKTVAKIGKNAFKDSINLTEVNIPSTIRIIDEYAFSGCSNLQTVLIPDGVEEIGYGAYAGCNSVNKIIVPDSLKKMDGFGSCDNIKTAGPLGSNSDYEFGWETAIPAFAFTGLDYLAEVELPDTIAQIGGGAFTSCESLSEIIIPDNVNEIGFEAFMFCKALKSIIIPDNVETIEGSAFAYCDSLETVVIGKKVTSIPDDCFIQDKALVSVDCSDNLQIIGNSAFSQCSQLQTANIGTGIKQIGSSAFSSCESLESIILPDSLESIGDYAFYYCQNLTEVVLSEGIVNIGECAFEYCPISELKIPNSVVSIGNQAFAHNGKLATLRIGKSVTTIGNETFYGAFGGYAGFTIYLPVSLKTIGENAFGSTGANMTTVLYSGSEDEWNEIQVAEGNELLMNARKIVFDYEPEEPEDPEEPGEEEDTLLQKSGMFVFDSPAMGRLAEYGFSYDESWFFNDNEIYQHDLAKMSLRMSMASYGYASLTERIKEPTTKYDGNIRIHYDTAEGAKSSSKLMVNLLKKLEFTDIWVHYPETTPDTIGYTIASKKIIKDNEEYTLIAVTTRGGGYFQEWGGNFTIGMGDEHDGFSNAGNQVYEAVKQYLTRLMINEGTTKNIKIWLSGYSRGAATINVAAHFLTTDAKAGRLKGVTAKNIFAYGFECPQSVRSSSGLLKENCKNIFSIVNYIDLVPKVAPSEPKSWGFQRLGVTYFLPAYELLSLSEYKTAYDKMKNEYRKILAVNNMENLVDKAAGELETTTGYLYDICLKNICSKTNPYEYTINHQDGIRHALASFNGADFETGKIINAVFSVLDISAYTFSVNPILLHINDIKNAHCPELCMAWMDSLTGDSNDFVYDPVYRVIIMNCPIDVEVYNEEGNLVAKIQNKEVINLESDIEVGAFIDDDEQIIIALPSYGNYQINITATDDGVMSYQIMEKNIDSGNVEKMIQYKDVEIKKDEVLLSTIGQMEEDHSAEYTLNNDEGFPIQPTKIIAQNEVEEYLLQVSTSGSGSVIGGGRYLDGEYAKISAESGDNFEFEGWYTGEQLVSSDPTTRICMDHNTELTACFKGISLNKTAVQIALGETFQIESTVYSKTSPDQSVTYYSADPDVAEVNDNGLVTGKKIGAVDIIVTSSQGLSTICKVIILVNGIYTRGLESSYIYTGTAIKPDIQVYDTGILLTPKTDYTITYKNTTKAYHVEDPENPTATDKKKAPQIIIKSNSKGNYKGTKTIYFSIEPLDINDEQITIDELSVQPGTKPVSPVPTVYFNGKKLKAKTDYIVDYNGWDQLTPGDVTIKILGKGNFQGTRDVTLHVASSDLISVAKLSVTSRTLKYADLNGDDFMKEIASAVTIKNGKKAVPTDGYYFEDIPEDYKKTGTVKFTLVGNEAAGFFGKKTVTVKITGIALTDKKIKAAVPTYEYTGEPQALGSDFSIKYSEELLEEGKDYTVESYSNNINAGTATAVLKGLNNYIGTRKVTFKITPADASGRVITVEDAYYTKGGSKPKVTVEGLVEGTDYTVKYANNKAVTTPNTSKLPTVTVTFKGSYKGTVTRDFYIDPKPLNQVTITSKDKVYSAKANAWKSVPVLKDTDGKALKAGTDYDKNIIYTTAEGEELPAVVEAGTVIKVTVTGKGNYTGTASTTYRILETGKDISKMTFKIANQEYTGSPVMIDEGDITSIKLGKKEQNLVLGRDYEIVSYTNNINKGTAKATFQGIGEYGGTKTVSFKVGQRSLTDYWNGVKSFFSKLMN